MSLPVKLALGAITLGSIGGVTYAGIAYSQQGTEISKLVEQEYEYILLDTTENKLVKDKSHWTNNWDNYKKANNGKDKDLFGLEGWNKANQGESYVALKKKCKELSKKTVKDSKDELYKNVTKYCGRYVTVKDEAEKKGFIILDITKPTPSGTNVWESKTKTPKADLEKLDIKEPTPNAEKIRASCEKAKDKNKEEKNYQEIYAAYVNTCANPKPIT